MSHDPGGRDMAGAASNITRSKSSSFSTSPCISSKFITLLYTNASHVTARTSKRGDVELDMDWLHSLDWIGLGWIGSGFSGNFMDLTGLNLIFGWDDRDPVFN